MDEPNDARLDTAAPTLPYGTPVDSGRRFSWSAFLCCLVVLSVFFGTQLFVVPQFEQTFKDFGTKLPTVTVILLDLSRLCDRFWYACLAMTIAAPVVLGFLVGLTKPRHAVATARLTPIQRRAAFLLPTLLFLGIYIFILIVALFLPMINLLQAVSGTGKK